MNGWMGWTDWAPYLSLFGLACAGLIYLYLKKQPVGTDVMRELSDAIHDGAMAFLKREYTILAIFVAVVFVVLYVALNPMTAVAFESPKRIGGLLGELAAAGLGERCCVICRELTKLHETIRRGTVAELAPEFGEETRGEITLVLEAAAESAGWKDLLDEIEREARQLGELGLSTRDIGAKLVEAFGVPRNVAYDFGLRFGRAEDRS